MKLTQAEIENIILRSKIEDLESRIKQLELNFVALEKTIGSEEGGTSWSVLHT